MEHEGYQLVNLPAKACTRIEQKGQLVGYVICTDLRRNLWEAWEKREWSDELIRVVYDASRALAVSTLLQMHND